MQTVSRVARKEFVEMLRDGRFRWSAGSVLLLLVVSLGLGIAHSREALREREEASRRDRNIWLNQGEKNPHSAAHYGVYAFKPQSMLSFADRGVEAYVGQAIWLEAHYQNLSQNRPAEDRTSLQRFGELTAAGVLQLLVPLLIVLLSFAAFAGEREQGTLRQLASLGLSPRALAAGKGLGVAAALTLLIVPAALIGAGALHLSAGSSLGIGLGRAVLLAVAYALYLGTFVALSLAVSAWAATSRLALVVLLGFWILNGLALPRALGDLAARLHPTPSATAFWTAIRDDIAEGLDRQSPAAQRQEALKQSVLREYGVEKLEDLPVSFAGISLQAGEEHGNQVFDKHFPALWDIYARQDRVQLLGGLAAPLLAVRSVSMGLAGTDFQHHRDFALAAEGHRRRLQKLMNEDLTRHAQGTTDYKAGHALWKQAPAFEYQAPGLGHVLRQQRAALSILLLWFAASFVAAVRASARARVA